jgi:hypothetical protein
MSRHAPNTLSRRWRVPSAFMLFTACFGGCRCAVAHHLDAHLMPPTRTSFLHGCKHGANRRTWREGRADVISFRRNDQHAAGGRCPKVAAFRNVGSAEASGERTRPRVQFPASRRKTLFGETPNTTRGDAYAKPRMRYNYSRRGHSPVLRVDEDEGVACQGPGMDVRRRVGSEKISFQIRPVAEFLS